MRSTIQRVIIEELAEGQVQVIDATNRGPQYVADMLAAALLTMRQALAKANAAELLASTQQTAAQA